MSDGGELGAATLTEGVVAGVPTLPEQAPDAIAHARRKDADGIRRR